MATLILGAAGSALGSAVAGPAGAIVGRAVGAFVGNTIDHHLFGQAVSRHTEGPRLPSLEVQASTEGAGLPLVFGRVRLAGQVIWATNYEEVVTTTRHKSGGKGGGGGGGRRQTTTTTSYSYFTNFAVGLCEGEIASVSRVWADGKPLDLNTVAMRVYKGTEDQEPDPLIAAKDGPSPAYRGTAYVVFERLPLEDFGRRLPQLAFEVLRPVGGLEDRIRAVTLIPGATEFGYHPDPVVRTAGAGVTEAENTHDPAASTDWHASLDQLQAVCPNLERVALVVAWFGTSLDAATCRIEPRVERRNKTTSTPWQAAGLGRTAANAVSRHDGRPAFGSSPDDASVIAAIRDLKARGLKVTLMPFIMMDVPENNALTDPWTGTAGQPAYPWRGHITVSPAPGRPGTPDKTAAAARDLAAFVGSASPHQFAVRSNAVAYFGPNEWSFRRFILHMASLCRAAGGVHAFLLGSELKSLTTVRDAPGSYPFVDALVSLAADVRQIVGHGCVLTYAADWSEYASHQPNDGSGDLTFHLDPLWASPDVDVIGIDQYQPITDWRHAADHLDRDLGASPYDPAVIEAGLTGGENFDWYYANEADRAAQVRTPITDGAYGEPWVYRSKDLVGWWSNPHHNRVGGVREPDPTAFVPGSKPIWLCEFGAPAVDLAGNTPSAFPSDKPGNDSLPYAAKGYRDDAQQRAILETALALWGREGSAANPLSPLDGRAMIDPSAIHLWTWDARPFPAFPYARDVWSDGVNWVRGHWLNGRLGAASLRALLAAMEEHFGLPPVDAGGVHGVVEGYKLADPARARGVLDNLSAVFALQLSPRPAGCAAAMRASGKAVRVPVGDLVEVKDTPLLAIARADPETLPRQITLGFSSSLHDYRTGVVRSARREGVAGPDEFLSLPLTLDPARAGQIAERLVQERHVAAQSVAMVLPPSLKALEPGDRIDLVLAGGATLPLCIDRLVDGAERQVEAHCIDPALYEVAPAKDIFSSMPTRPVFGAPDLVVLDLPAHGDAQAASHNVRLAAFADPWPGSLDVFTGSQAEGFAPAQALTTPAVLGRLAEGAAPGPVAYIHHGGTCLVDAPTGSLSSITQAALMNGGNLAALVSGDRLEVLQFHTAELVEPGRYRLAGLIRGLGGTEDAAATPWPAGARFVLLEGSVEPLNTALDVVQRGTTVRVEPHKGGVAGLARAEGSVVAIPRSLRPLAPVHLRAGLESDGSLFLTWQRRARTGGDDWSLTSVPLGEERELYQITVMDGTRTLRVAEAQSPAWTYTLADQTADGLTPASLPATLTITVRQLGTGGRAGAARSIRPFQPYQ